MRRGSVVDGLVGRTEGLLLDGRRDVQLSVAQDYATALKRHKNIFASQIQAVLGRSLACLTISESITAGVSNVTNP